MQMHPRSRPDSRALVHLACLLFACCDANWCLSAGSEDAASSTGSETASSDTSSSETASSDTTGPDLCGNAKCDPGEAQSCPGDCEGCGDGTLAGSEECDDGNAVDDDACTNSCTLPACGDKILQGDEVCDDGSANSDAPWSETKRCKADCQGYTEYCGDGTCQPEFEQSCTEDLCAATCGDGKIEGDEACDDGNDDETDACLNNCEKARCGDGVVLDGTEECDDGNAIQNDACLATCVAATCGDGILQEGVEPCDDGNDVETDTCDSQCLVVEHRKVFVSSKKYTGDLSGFSGDNICQFLGEAMNYKAWLTSGAQGPADRLDTTFTGVYELPSGEFIAKGWADLTDDTLAHAIDQDEDGNIVGEGAVWTNSLPEGMPIGMANCGDWKSKQFASKGAVGNSGETLAAWTHAETELPCSNEARLYCIEEPAP